MLLHPAWSQRDGLDDLTGVVSSSASLGEFLRGSPSACHKHRQDSGPMSYSSGACRAPDVRRGADSAAETCHFDGEQPLDRRERNRRAQVSYRRRLKERTEQQSKQLRHYKERIAVLEARAKTVQQLPRTDLLQPSAVQELDARRTDLETASGRSVLANTSSVRLERALLQAREQQVKAALYMIGQAQHLRGEARDREASLIAAELGRLNGMQPVQLSLARSQHLQELKPLPSWQEACPVPIEGLYAALYSGSFEHKLPVTVGPSAGAFMTFREIANMLPSMMWAWRAQYIQRMSQLSQQRPAPTLQLEKLVGELCCVMAIMSVVSPWAYMGAQGQHILDHDLRAPEDYHCNCLTACCLTHDQQAGTSKIVHVFLQQQKDLVRKQHLLINAIGHATQLKGPPLHSGREQATFLAALSNLRENLALQHENRQHVTRQFVYGILSPLDLCNMLLASGPYILDIPAAICSSLHLNGCFD
ncbi:hypothetical protein WJX74_003628 [Apatococcus lobatus]|uniref:BZIP domain-containing protein n=1 Tax=Apatococcus lobatus TaxID=904363 RepID=A0AAW1RVR1_9CHLO